MASCVEHGAIRGLGTEIVAGKDGINFWLLKNEVYRGFTGPDEAPPARKHMSFTYNKVRLHRYICLWGAHLSGSLEKA